jgi:DUF1009 family protein
MDTLGIIAGNRSLPLLFAKEARRQGVQRLVAVAFEGESPQTLETCAAGQIAVLAFEAAKTLLLEQDTCAALARKHKIAVTTVG